MAMVEINWKPADRELRQFAGIWFPLMLIAGGLVAWLKFDSLRTAAGIWSVGFVVSLVGYLKPPAIKPIFIGLMIVTFPIGFVMSYIILAVTYFLVLTPIGLLMRLLGRDPMQRRFDRSAKSYWVEHNPGGDTKRYFRQF